MIINIFRRCRPKKNVLRNLGCLNCDVIPLITQFWNVTFQEKYCTQPRLHLLLHHHDSTHCQNTNNNGLAQAWALLKSDVCTKMSQLLSKFSQLRIHTSCYDSSHTFRRWRRKKNVVRNLGYFYKGYCNFIIHVNNHHQDIPQLP